MKQLGISIIGTDTDVGKTFVTGLLGAIIRTYESASLTVIR